MVFYSRRSRRCWPCCCGIVQCHRMLWYCIKCFCDSDVQISFKNLYQVNSRGSVLQFSYLFRTFEIKRTGHCKIQDLSVGQKEVWGKLVKCHIEEGESENRICSIKLFGQGIYCSLSQREHVEGRKEGKEQEVIVLGGLKGSGKHAIHHSRRTGWSIRVSWPASRYCLDQN